MKSSASDNLALTAARAGTLELPAELLEFSIDQALEDGILKDIPFIGWLAKGISAGIAISDRILYQKILRFVVALDSIGSGDKENFRSKINHDPKFRRKVGEHLIVIIDKIDSPEKCDFIAIAFDHCLTGDIEHDQFTDLAHIINGALLSDLRAISVPDNQRLMFSGTSLAAASGLLEYGMARPEPGEQTRELGTKLSKHAEDLRDMFLGRYRTREKHESERREAIRKRFDREL